MSHPRVEPSRTSSSPVLVAWFAAYGALAVVLTFPLVLRLGSGVPHDLGDPLLSASILWWNAHVVPLTTEWWNGFSFFPSGGTITFSDHRLGASLLASPLQWLGATPLVAYNITWLLSFPPCAVAAHWLAFTLTRRHDAAVVCGLAYGFNPYRIAHLEHLELLLAFGMPAGLACLHLYLETRRTRWAMAFGAALVVQALSGSYYLLFFGVLLGLWIPWFLRWEDRRVLAGMLAAASISALVMFPLLAGYWRIHRAYALGRSYTEIATYSADVSSLFTASPLLTLWGWTSSWNGIERQIFPGLTISLVALAGVVTSWRRIKPPRDRLTIVSYLFGLLAVACAVVAVSVALKGPWRSQVGPLAISAGTLFKPLSIAVACVFAAIAFHPRARDSYRRRSPYAFYTFATVILFICSFGPQPTWNGQQVLYEPPYSWLMRLPVFDHEIRVPARFAMLAVLTLSVAGSLAFAALARRRTFAWVLLVVLAGGIVADSWIRALPLPAIPQTWSPSRADGVSAVLELPLGEIARDVMAVYRTTLHHHPTINGYSGYEPGYYPILRSALAGHDPSALDAIAESGPHLIAIDSTADRDASLRTFVAAHRSVTPAGDENGWSFFRLARQSPPVAACHGDALPIAALDGEPGPLNMALLVDGNSATRSLGSHPQHAGDTLTIDLGHPVRPCALAIAAGTDAYEAPRAVTVSTSLDGGAWHTVFTGKTGGAFVKTMLEAPKDVRFEVALPKEPTRLVRVRIDESVDPWAWSVSDIVVRGSR